MGTKRDSEALRERVKKLLNETRAGFKSVGEGVKRVQDWPDVSVSTSCPWTGKGGSRTTMLIAPCVMIAKPTLRAAKTLARDVLYACRFPDHPAAICREDPRLCHRRPPSAAAHP